MADARDSAALDARRGVRPDWAARAEALAASDALQSAVSLFHREKKWINERHLELCRTPALTFREQQRAELLSQMFADLGLAAQIDDAGNVVAPVVFDKKLPFVRELCLKYENIDPVKQMIPVRPVVHYMMGGVSTDIRGATPLPGLFAAGEVACVSINGANRLGSNSRSTGSKVGVLNLRDKAL